MPSGSDPAQFNLDGARRIVEITRRVEAMEINVKTLQRNLTRRLSPILPTIAFTQATLAPQATGNVKLGFGTPGTEAELAASQLISATNSTGHTVWNGSLCVMAWLMVEQSEGSGWHIIQSNSAKTVTAVVNEASGVATGDSTYDVVVMAAQSGVFFPDTTIAGVRNLHAWKMDNNAVVQLVYNETANAWDTVQVTCPA
jgi:hypothetical protein